LYWGDEEEKREEREKKGDKREYIRSAHTVTPKAAVEIPFVGNTNLQV